MLISFRGLMTRRILVQIILPSYVAAIRNSMFNVLCFFFLFGYRIAICYIVIYSITTTQ